MLLLYLSLNNLYKNTLTAIRLVYKKSIFSEDLSIAFCVLLLLWPVIGNLTVYI